MKTTAKLSRLNRSTGKYQEGYDTVEDLDVEIAARAQDANDLVTWAAVSLLWTRSEFHSVDDEGVRQ